MGYSAKEKEKILFLVAHHDDFMAIKDSETKDLGRLSGIISKAIGESDNVSLKDFQMLLTLCRADVIAQAKVVEKGGVVIETREDRVRRYEEIYSSLPDAIVYKQDKEMMGIESRRQTLLNGPTPVVIEGKVKKPKTTRYV